MKYSWEVDDFDSKVFGIKVAKIAELDPKQVNNLLRDLIKNKVSYATYRVQANNFPTIHAIEQAGFLLVDGLISLSLDLSSISSETALEIREAKKGDLKELKKLTTDLYSNTRITNDPLVPKDKANKYYLKWIENSVNGSVADSVLIWEERAEILGYITLQKRGQIPLVGVSEKARGKGIARSLLNGAFAKFKKWGVETINIDTQMGNIPALRAYQRAGFKIVDSHSTFRWTI